MLYVRGDENKIKFGGRQKQYNSALARLFLCGGGEEGEMGRTKNKQGKVN